MYFGSCWTLWTRGVLALGVTILLLSTTTLGVKNRHRHWHSRYKNNSNYYSHHHHKYDESKLDPRVSSALLPRNLYQWGHVSREKNHNESFYHADKWSTSAVTGGGADGVENTRNNLGDEDRERFKRYSKYVGYTTSRLTVKQQPMAYVHIKPASPTPTNRKCVRCMVVYKPCKSPPKIVLPVNRYQEPAKKWRGLMYGK